jgi:hypothetical protein
MADTAQKFQRAAQRQDPAVFDFDAEVAQAIEKGDATPIRALAETVLTTTSPGVFKYGSAALQLCIDQQTAGLVLTGEYWINVRLRLAGQQKISAQPKLLLPASGAQAGPLLQPVSYKNKKTGLKLPAGCA